MASAGLTFVKALNCFSKYIKKNTHACVRAQITKPALSTHTATLIWSHGLGDTGSGWSFLAQELGKAMPHVKFLFPNAPVQPVTLNMGMPMPSWYEYACTSPLTHITFFSYKSLNHVLMGKQHLDAGRV